MGKKANCQAAVSLHYVGKAGHVPLGLRLFLPESWLEAPAWLDKAGVPESGRRALSKGEIALELLDAVRAENGLPGQVVVGDSGYGVSGPLRAGLAARGLHYVLGATGEMVVFTGEPRWVEPGPSGGGRPRHRHRLDKDGPQPLSLRAVAAQTPLRKVTWRAGTKGAMAGRFAWLQVWPAHGWATESARARNRSGCSSRNTPTARSSTPSATCPPTRRACGRCARGASVGRSSRAISR